MHRFYFMMNSLTRTILYLLFVWMPLFLPACSTMRNCPIETLQPAKLALEGPKNSIALCASETVLSEAIATNETATGVPADSLITNILFSLQHDWEKVPGFDEAQFLIYIIKTDSLYEDFNFDLVVQLDRLQIKNIYYGQQYAFNLWEAYMYVQYSAKWTIRNSSGTLIDEFTDRNLMAWPSGIQEGKSEAVENLPDVKDAWWDMGIAIAQNYADRIVPKWQTGMRRIYMVNKFPELSQQAYTAMQNDAYGRAFDMWENMLLSCRKIFQKRIKSQITYNMAVAYEFQNQLDQSVYWAQQSANLKKKSKTVNYLKLLHERQQHQIKLDQQTSRL